jgi:hypothetical protein
VGSTDPRTVEVLLMHMYLFGDVHVMLLMFVLCEFSMSVINHPDVC